MNNTTYEPQRLTRWTYDSDYLGPDFGEYFIVKAMSRDADPLARSNFDAILRDLGGESETVIVVTAGHWACGSIKWIGIHESDTDALIKADAMIANLDAYPVHDDALLCEYEHDEFQSLWKDTNCILDNRDRLRYLRFNCGTDGDFRTTRAAVNGDPQAAMQCGVDITELVYA